VKSLENASSKPTDAELECRRKILGVVIEEAKKRGDIINENYLLYHMKLHGFENYTRMQLYNDRLHFDSQNNYIMNFLPRYSKYQEEISEELDKIRDEAIELGRLDWIMKKVTTRETKEGEFVTETITQADFRPKAEFLKIRAKVAELKQKHGDGQNIQIAAVIIGKEFQRLKAKIQKLEENEQPKISGCYSK